MSQFEKKDSKENNLLRQRIDQVEKSYRITKVEFDEHGHGMDSYLFATGTGSLEIYFPWKMLET